MNDLAKSITYTVNNTINAKCNARKLSFKQSHLFDVRVEESKRIRSKYPDRVPCIVEIANGVKDMPPISKNKYLVPADLTSAQFLYVIRKRLDNLPAEKALFLFCNGIIPSSSALMNCLYEEHCDTDGFLYFQISNENVFG